MTNHSSKMKKVLTPMQKELANFYKEKKRYPTDKERNTLLEKSGCKLNNDHCNNFKIISDIDGTGYTVGLLEENSRCYTGLSKKGNIEKISCYQDSCLELRQ